MPSPSSSPSFLPSFASLTHHPSNQPALSTGSAELRCDSIFPCLRVRSSDIIPLTHHTRLLRDHTPRCAASWYDFAYIPTFLSVGRYALTGSV